MPPRVPMQKMPTGTGTWPTQLHHPGHGVPGWPLGGAVGYGFHNSDSCRDGRRGAVAELGEIEARGAAGEGSAAAARHAERGNVRRDALTYGKRPLAHRGWVPHPRRAPEAVAAPDAAAGRGGGRSSLSPRSRSRSRREQQGHEGAGDPRAAVGA